MSMTIPRSALAVTATLSVIASITPAHGVFKTWTPLPGNPLFEQANNWSPTGVPNDADSLIFLDLGVPISDVQLPTSTAPAPSASPISVLLHQWGPCTDTADCPTDFNGDGSTGFFDLSLLLNAWGSC